MNSLGNFPCYPVTKSQGYSANFCSHNGIEKCNKDVFRWKKKLLHKKFFLFAYENNTLMSLKIMFFDHFSFFGIVS